MLIKFKIDTDSPKQFELRMDSIGDQKETPGGDGYEQKVSYQYLKMLLNCFVSLKEMEVEKRMLENCRFPISCDNQLFQLEHFFEFHL